MTHDAKGPHIVRTLCGGLQQGVGLLQPTQNGCGSPTFAAIYRPMAPRLILRKSWCVTGTALSAVLSMRFLFLL